MPPDGAFDRQPSLEGETLWLRPMRPDDWEAAYAVASDPDIWALHPAHDRWREDVFRRYFEDGLASGGMMAVIDKATGALIGSSRFHRREDGLEIGYTFLARSHWGGATNRAMKRLMLTHALASHERVIFRVGETNWRSRRAMEKIGGRLLPEGEQVESGGRVVPHVLFEITRTSFAEGPLNREADCL